MKKKYVAVILAAGSGDRFSGEGPKQFAGLAGKTLLQHGVDRFVSHPGIHGVYLVIHPDFLAHARALFEGSRYSKVRGIVAGGTTRQESSYIGIRAVPEDVDGLLIHDAARPLVTDVTIDAVLGGLDRYGAVTSAISVSDTLVEIDDSNCLLNVPARESMMRVQTPQAFRRPLVLKAHQLAAENGITNATDDCGLIHRFQLTIVHVVPGSETNIKITHPGDLALAEQIIKIFNRSERGDGD